MSLRQNTFRDYIFSTLWGENPYYKSIILSHYNFSTHALETEGCLPNVTDIDFEGRLPQPPTLQQSCVLGELTLDRTRVS